MDALFPLFMLQGKEKLVDPTNLQTIYDYYLLENLAAGLVRDDDTDARGYSGVLAADWAQRDALTWAFRLREGASWSNGTPITGTELVAYFDGIRARKNRHLVQLGTLDGTQFEAQSRTLVLSFSSPTNDFLLHELSLGDAALVSEANRAGDWSITSGPYFVASRGNQSTDLRLKLNPRNILSRATSPPEVRLFWPAERSGAFLQGKADLYLQPSLVFRRQIQDLRKAAAQVFEGAPAIVSYFKFNPASPLSRSEDTRRVFSAIVEEALNSIVLPKPLVREDQMVPPGYAGRLERAPQSPDASKKSEVKDLRIAIGSALDELAGFSDALTRAASKHGIALTLDRSESPKVDDESIFASTAFFRGNQRDAAGSLMFLVSAGGPLAQFADELQPQLQHAASVADKAERAAALAETHRRILANHFVVPLWVEPPAILASSRVDLSALNPFDARLRFYEMALR